VTVAGLEVTLPVATPPVVTHLTGEVATAAGAVLDPVEQALPVLAPVTRLGRGLLPPAPATGPAG
jgi:hypothetical protein